MGSPDGSGPQDGRRRAGGSAMPAGVPLRQLAGGGGARVDAPLPSGGAGPDLPPPKVHERAEKESGVDGEAGGG